MQTFFGSVVLPEDCTTHDVCSLIKRFFRELKTPLFAQMQTQLLDVSLEKKTNTKVMNISKNENL